MSEEENNNKEVKEKVITKEVHVGLTQEQLDSHIHKLREEMSELGVKDAAEKAELRAEIEDLKEHKKRLEDAEKKREEVKDSKHTMVLPPNNIPPAQPNISPQESNKKRKMSWW